MSFSGVISGLVLCVAGIFAIISISYGSPLIFIPLGIILIVTGLYMIIKTKEEDKIEQIRKK